MTADRHFDKSLSAVNNQLDGLQTVEPETDEDLNPADASTTQLEAMGAMHELGAAVLQLYGKCWLLKYKEQIPWCLV